MGRALHLPDVFRDAGLQIELDPGWETRGSDNFDPKWIVEHHDVSPEGMQTMPRLLADGRGGPNPVSGPLCNWYPLRSGVIRIVASGRANHAGVGMYPDGTTGNRLSYGSEGANNGTGEPWPERQLEAMAMADAALCRFHGWGAERVIGHKEYALPKGRKVDPSYDMNLFRLRVAELLKSDLKPVRPEEDDMPLSNEDLSKIASAVWGHKVHTPSTPQPATLVMKDIMHHARKGAGVKVDIDTKALAAELVAALDPTDLAEAITEAGVTEAVKTALREGTG